MTAPRRAGAGRAPCARRRGPSTSSITSAPPPPLVLDAGEHPGQGADGSSTRAPCALRVKRDIRSAHRRRAPRGPTLNSDVAVEAASRGRDRPRPSRRCRAARRTLYGPSRVPRGARAPIDTGNGATSLVRKERLELSRPFGHAILKSSASASSATLAPALDYRLRTPDSRR